MASKFSLSQFYQPTEWKDLYNMVPTEAKQAFFGMPPVDFISEAARWDSLDKMELEEQKARDDQEKQSELANIFKANESGGMPELGDVTEQVASVLAKHGDIAGLKALQQNPPDDKPIIQKSGNDILERQPDGTWKTAHKGEDKPEKVKTNKYSGGVVYDPFGTPLEYSSTEEKTALLMKGATSTKPSDTDIKERKRVAARQAKQNAPEDTGGSFNIGDSVSSLLNYFKGTPQTPGQPLGVQGAQQLTGTQRPPINDFLAQRRQALGK